MSEITKKEIASALKLCFVIIVAIITYSSFSPKYHFMRQGQNIYRGDKFSGSIEFLEDNEWILATESEFSTFLRVERKKVESERIKKMKKRFLDAKDLPDDEDEF